MLSNVSWSKLQKKNKHIKDRNNCNSFRKTMNCTIYVLIIIDSKYLFDKPCNYNADSHTEGYVDLISSKILEISNSFLFVVDKERMSEFVKFFS